MTGSIKWTYAKAFFQIRRRVLAQGSGQHLRLKWCVTVRVVIIGHPHFQFFFERKIKKKARRLPGRGSNLTGNSVSDNRQETCLTADLINRAGHVSFGVNQVGHVAGNVDDGKILHTPATSQERQTAWSPSPHVNRTANGTYRGS